MAQIYFRNIKIRIFMILTPGLQDLLRWRHPTIFDPRKSSASALPSEHHTPGITRTTVSCHDKRVSGYRSIRKARLTYTDF